MSLQTHYKRIVKAGFVNFYRSGVVSIASVLVMTVTLFIISALLLLNAILNFSLAEIQNKVDINVYFYPESAESQVLEFKTLLEGLPEVAEVTYVSREQALVDFQERHEGDFLTLQALEELGENPLGASLNVRATDSTLYENIARFIEGEAKLVTDAENSIERVNYRQNEPVIKKLNNIIFTVRTLGLAVTLLFVIISVLIAFNTIRLGIYTSREEISIMRLVGAENKYIKGPFVIQGIIYGIVSSVITMAALFPITDWLSAQTMVFFGGMNIHAYYLNNFFPILLILVVVGVFLGVVSSSFAIRKYLRK